jgi:hypothetical protein
MAQMVDSDISVSGNIFVYVRDLFGCMFSSINLETGRTKTTTVLTTTILGDAFTGVTLLGPPLLTAEFK